MNAPSGAALLNSLHLSLPDDVAAEVNKSIKAWQAAGNMKRLWSADASLWTGQDEAKWLGWTGVVDRQQKQAAQLREMAQQVARDGFTHAVLLGMGGSSLGPEVLATTFRARESYPHVLVLDSTDPAQIRRIENAIDPARTLFIVSSKSGTTLEPNVLKQYFFARVGAAIGMHKAGAHFIAITDPGSKLEEVARRDGFRYIAAGEPAIGGRYSVLSHFGMVPAAIMGIDVERLLAAAQAMVRACGPEGAVADNPGAVLGTVLGVLGRAGRDKVTIIASPGIADFGAWTEQLLAESTGKHGKGLIPVADEPLGPPAVYGRDRVFAYLRLPEADSAQDQAVTALEKAGHPVVRIDVTGIINIGQEFFRWEMATAVAGAILGINPFDQPDVEASKVKTRELTSTYEQTGKLPQEIPVFDGDGVKVFADDSDRKIFTGLSALEAVLQAHFSRLQSGDYFALLAYMDRNSAHQDALQKIRRLIRDRTRAATCLGFGPRFLHSTGQAYKGGPNTGVFLQITCDDAADINVPDQKYSFGVVKSAEARGDFQVLAERGRRALRVHLGADVAAGLRTLNDAVTQALA